MTTTQLLAKEGVRGGIVLTFLFLLFFLLGSDFFAFLFFCLLGLWLYMFRNPERLPAQRVENAFLAPCDGRIENIEYKDNAVIMSFKIAYLDVGILRAPFCASHFASYKTNGLKTHFANPAVKNLLNTHLTLSTDNFEMEIIPDMFDAMAYDVKKIYTGDRIGFCKIGTLRLKMQTDSVEIKANVGDILRSGETLLGYVK